eukprot:4274550-Alexandrium_andersonii.AAC.1
MSASLVGSEMCIRDRLSAACTPQHSAALCSLHSAALCSRACTLEHSAAPVSYTHLTLPTICSV